jgi:hypothetical protein
MPPVTGNRLRAAIGYRRHVLSVHFRPAEPVVHRWALREIREAVAWSAAASSRGVGPAITARTAARLTVLEESRKVREGLISRLAAPCL